VTIDIGTVHETLGRRTGSGQPFEVDECQIAGATQRVFINSAATAVEVIQSQRGHSDADLLVFNDQRSMGLSGFR
jgi:hypothetical protein